MGIPGYPFLRDFRDPVMIIGTPFSMQTADDTGDAYDSGGYSQSSGKEWPCVKRPINKGSRDHVPAWTDGRFVLEMEDRRISKELHSDEQSADRKLSFTAAIYNCLRYQQDKAA